MEEKVFFDGEFGKICGVLHKVDNNSEIVIVLHGFSSNKETGAIPTAQTLNQIGLNALRIDFDNRGESELDFETGVTIPNYVKQVEAAIKYVKDLCYKEISLIGTSYGGMVAFAVALSHPEIKRMVLRAPVVDYQKHSEWLYGKEEVKNIINKGYMIHHSKKKNKDYKVTSDFIEKSYPYSMYDHAQEIKIPVLILQGDEDKSVNYQDVQKVIKLFHDAKLHIIKGAGHNLGVNGDFSEGLQVMKEFFSNN